MNSWSCYRPPGTHIRYAYKELNNSIHGLPRDRMQLLPLQQQFISCGFEQSSFATLFSRPKMSVQEATTNLKLPTYHQDKSIDFVQNIRTLVIIICITITYFWK